MTRRNKSNLAPAAQAEPETGPGSATCFCRRMDRRAKAEEARQRLLAEATGNISPDDGPKFADFQIVDVVALDEFYAAVSEKLRSGVQYRIRVAVL